LCGFAEALQCYTPLAAAHVVVLTVLFHNPSIPTPVLEPEVPKIVCRSSHVAR
jgi:hypothetical protein